MSKPEEEQFPDFSLDQIATMQRRSSRSHDSDDDSLYAKNADDTSASFKKTASVTTKTTSTSTSSYGRRNIWSEMTQIGYMATQKDVWDDDGQHGDDNNRKSNCALMMENFRFFCRGVIFETMHRLKTICSYPYILLWTILVFLALSAASIFLILSISDNMQKSLDLDTSFEAMQTATWFAEIFTKALIPLRSLQLAVKYSPAFRELPYKIGNYGAVGAAPSIQGPKSTNPELNDYRDVTGICDDPALIEEFQSLVGGINMNFEFEDVIFTYRMAPYGVYCLVDPTMVELGDGKVLNNIDEIGFEPIRSEDTEMKNMLQDIYYNKNKIHMFGPGDNKFMGIDGLDVMCGHLAVEIPGYNYQLDGQERSIWGYVMHFIDWSALKEKSGIYKYYKGLEYSFQLTRTDMVINSETGETSYQDVIIASSEPWPEGHSLFSTNDDPFTDSNSIKSTVQTEDSGEWTMYVKSHRNFREENWYTIIIAVVLSFIVSCIVAATLTEKKLNTMLLYKIMPTDAVKKLNRGQTVIERYNVVTIFFSDIVGFTSMCGEMKPIQIMKMLNELYMQFDKLVEKHGVYKVETIGDAYMVVGGAPQRIPAPEAAQKVAMFALEAMELVKSFTTTDGDKVIIRAGIASGPVVAGVVGTSMPRYCFFGDTVNLASRMESNSIKLKIQCSDFTYRLLRDAPNYQFNIEMRDTLVDLKGKGLTQTWWITGISGGRTSLLAGDLDISFFNKKETNDPFVQSMALGEQKWTRIGLPDSTLVTATSDKDTMINRITSILEYRLSMALNNPGSISESVKKEIHTYVRHICGMYNKVDFHSFEHASHVTISMNKLVDLFQKASNNFTSDVEMAISVPLTDSSIYFALVFACLVHDVQHTGHPNKVLEDTQHSFFKKYKSSCQEKNSIDVALSLLSSRKYNKLREMIYYVMGKESFEKIVHWAIISTDIVSSDNNKNIINRYETLYNSSKPAQDRRANFSIEDSKNNLHDKLNSDPSQRVAIEHAIQLADVAHLSQSWETFLKWNYRFFKECMQNYENKLVDDPRVNWSKGQVGFLSNYGIPLVSRVNDIFGDGISALTLVENVEANVRHWEREGDRITSLFISGYKSKDRERDILLSCLDEEAYDC